MEEAPKPHEKKDGLDAWAEELLNSGQISQKGYKDFIEKNNSKEAEMEARNLPQLRHYGYFSSLDEIKSKFTPSPNDRFIIRCVSKKDGEVKRLINTSFEDLYKFAENLPGGFEEWAVEIKEFIDTVAAGTIIVTPTGKTTIETWRGPHYLNTSDNQKYYGTFDPDQFSQHFEWKSSGESEDLTEMQGYAMRAFRYLFPHLKPRPNEPLYAEYGVKSTGEIYFIEANDSTLLTKI